MPESHSTVIPALRYRNAPAAIDWLCQVFGFERHAVYEGPNGTIGHAELTLNGGMIMLGSAKDDEHGRSFKSPDELDGMETRSAYIVVPDADAAHAHIDFGQNPEAGLCCLSRLRELLCYEQTIERHRNARHAGDRSQTPELNLANHGISDQQVARLGAKHHLRLTDFRDR